MKHTKAILLILLLVGGVFSLSAKELTQAEQVEIWNSANDAYGKGAYDEAIVAYDSLLASGYESAKLYYNLGNAYFKNNRIGKAILNYNRALQLAPSSEDIQYNLQVANAHTVNRIDAVPEFFLTTWFRSLRTMFNSNGWAVLSLIFLGITLAGAMVYLLSGTVRGRKIGFSAGVIALILFIFAVSFSIRQKKPESGFFGSYRNEQCGSGKKLSRFQRDRPFHSERRGESNDSGQSERLVRNRNRKRKQRLDIRRIRRDNLTPCRNYWIERSKSWPNCRESENVLHCGSPFTYYDSRQNRFLP